MPGPYLCLPVNWEIGKRKNKADVLFWPCYQREGIAHALYSLPLCHMHAISTNITMAKGRSCSPPKLLCRFGSSLATLVTCVHIQSWWAAPHGGMASDSSDFSCPHGSDATLAGDNWVFAGLIHWTCFGKTEGHFGNTALLLVMSWKAQSQDTHLMPWHI